METRKITIVATREQKKYVIESAATTLGELKADLRENGINYTDMAFMEGLTRSEILSDDSILPHDVPRTNRETGETYTTNELVFMLTNNQKKIASGVDRAAVYARIHELGVEEDIKNAFGKNFTMVKTDDLVQWLDDWCTESMADEPEHECDCQCECPEHEDDLNPVEMALGLLINALVGAGVIRRPQKIEIKEEDKSPYSDSEIAEMFRNI